MKANIKEKIKGEYKSDVTLYQMNQQLVFQTGVPISEEDLEADKKLIDNFITKKFNQYYLLNCKDEDFNYITIFHLDTTSQSNIEDDIISCLKDCGQLISIENCEDYLECWVKQEKTARMIMFFPADHLVISTK